MVSAHNGLEPIYTHMTPATPVGIGIILISLVIVVAIIVAPIVALKFQRKADEAREWKNRKVGVFKTLMSNRSTRLNPAFVQALNMIDIEFTAASEKGIQDAWKKLLDHYNDWGRKTPEQRKLDEDRDFETVSNLLAELLVKMGKQLGYDFDKGYIMRSCFRRG